MMLLFVAYILAYIYESIRVYTFKVLTAPALFAISFVLFGIINMVIHRHDNYFNVICPFFAYIGYHFFLKNNINTRIFDIGLIGLYIFYIIVYYSVIPDLWFRPAFDEDGVVFDISSSNAIPISLNVFLYAFMLIDICASNSRKTSILIYSVFNLILCVIQQSRAGILVALIIFSLAAFRISIRFILIGAILLTFVVLQNLELITGFIELIGDLKGIESFEKDPRGDAQSYFLKNLDSNSFMWGYGKKRFGESDFVYTYNIFLDVWNRYGFIQFLILIFIFVLRFIKYKYYTIPLIFFLPFFVYSFVESIFLPNYWDGIVYILLFHRKSKI